MNELATSLPRSHEFVNNITRLIMLIFVIPYNLERRSQFALRAFYESAMRIFFFFLWHHCRDLYLSQWDAVIFRTELSIIIGQ